MSNFPDYGFIDMHIHILPGVDDGSKDMDMSLAMLKVAAENNCDTIIITPHQNMAHHCVSPKSMVRRLDELKTVSLDHGYDFEFYTGNELFYDRTLPERLANEEVMTLADSDYCLIEFNPNEEYDYIFNGLREVAYEDFRPILAHCERYNCLVKKPERCRDLVRNGVYLQVNAVSVVPKLFNPIPKFVNGLLQDRLVSFVSTDAHRAQGRAPEWLECWRHLSRHYDADYVREILRDNADKVIYNEEL